MDRERRDLLAILQKSLDQALFLYNFIRELRSSGIRALLCTKYRSIQILSRIAERSINERRSHHIKEHIRTHRMPMTDF